MRKLTHFRFCILFLVLGLLLSFGLSGCTEDDREHSTQIVQPPSPTESPEPTPEPSPSPIPSGTISYLFLIDDGTAQKVTIPAAEAALTAYDADGKKVEGAALRETYVDAMKREGDYYVAEADVPETAELLVYTFRCGGTVDGVYAIGLTCGVDRYIMSYKDIVDEPELTVYADPEYTAEQSVFSVGDPLYPQARAVTKGGLTVPVASIVPADTGVVSYTEGSDAGGASYQAAGEGQTAFFITCGEAEFESAASVTVSPLTPAWILPPGYELKDGMIYNGDEQISDPSSIDAKLNLQAGGSARCLLIAAAGGEGGAASYKRIDAEAAAEITSDTAAHFSAAAQDGTLTVEVSAEAEGGETASVACTAAGFEFRNQAEVTVVSTRKITVYVPCNSYPNISVPVEVTYMIRIAAIGAGDQAVPGARLDQEDISEMKSEELGTRDDPYWKLEAEVPANAETVLLLYDIRTYLERVTNDEVAPYFAFALTDEDSYILEEYDYFPQLGFYGSQPGFYGTFFDAAFTQPTKNFCIGEQVYFYPAMTNEGGKITVKVTGIKPDDTDVIDENLKAVGLGRTWLTGNWYGIEGYVFPASNTYLEVYDGRL